jgi:hypothetical protein
MLSCHAYSGSERGTCAVTLGFKYMHAREVSKAFHSMEWSAMYTEWIWWSKEGSWNSQTMEDDARNLLSSSPALGTLLTSSLEC